jgi:YesN/AraC family two-component response regulator
MKFKNSKYRNKLILFGVALGTIPVALLGIFSYFKSSSIIQEKVNQSNSQILYQTEMRVEEVLKSIQYYYFVLANSPAITDHLNEKLTYMNYDTVTDIQRRLIGMQAVQASVKGVLYANFQNDWVISNQGMGALRDKLNVDNLGKITNNPKNSFWIYNKKELNLYMDKDSDFDSEAFNPADNITLAIKLPLNSNMPKGALFVNLQGNEFIKSAAQSGRLDEMMVLDGNYDVLIRDGDNLLEDEARNTLISELKEKNIQQGFYKFSSTNKKLGISFRKSNYSGWTYVSVYNISDITEDSRTIGWVTFIICLAMMLGVSFISILGSSVIYNPIKNIYDTVVKSIDPRNNARPNDEFAYIGEGINTLVTKHTEMEEQLQRQMVQLEELFLIKLVNGELDKNEIALKLVSLGYEKLWNWLGIISIQIDSFENTKYRENDRELIMFSINNIICDVVSKDVRFNPALINKVQVVLVGGDQNTQEAFKESTYEISTAIQENVKKLLGLGISVGISRTFHELSNTQIAYKESIEALMCSIRFGEETLLYFEDVQPEVEIKQSYPNNIEEELISAINHGEAEKAEKLLNDLVDDISKKKLSFSEYQVCITRLLINIIGILQDSGESVNILFDKQDRLFDELYALTNLNEIKKWFNKVVIKPVINRLEERRGSQYKNILTEVIRMIEEEYDTDISLESCAARLNYHPSYIWRVLKKEMDITFSDYLSKFRLTKAKQLLEQSDMPIGEIAEKLRYNNSQNFIRYFKKLEGVTPGQYREKFKASL